MNLFNLSFKIVYADGVVASVESEQQGNDAVFTAPNFAARYDTESANIQDQRNKMLSHLFSFWWDHFEVDHVKAKSVLYNANLKSFHLFTYMKRDSKKFNIAWILVDDLKKMTEKANNLITKSRALLTKAIDTTEMLEETYEGELPAEEVAGPWREALFFERQIFKIIDNFVKVVSMTDYLYLKCKLHVSSQEQKTADEHKCENVNWMSLWMNLFFSLSSNWKHQYICIKTRPL